MLLSNFGARPRKWKKSVFIEVREERMKARTFLMCLSVVFLAWGLGGCSVSVSASAGNKTTLEGQKKIKVTAAQPEAPPKPEPPKVAKKERKAKLVGKKIEITEKVMFDYNKATIKVDSNELLNDVATVFTENAKIKKVRIEGHTDSDGKDAYNKKLSQERADAVKAFLVKAGIDETRLEAVGYGEERPIADNATDEGKENNRRVEFNVLEQ
jgi:OOP family OmpA-OmpF porin